MQSKDEVQESPSYFKKALGFIADYFLYSEERATAWCLLIAAILCTLILVGITFLFSYISTAFWAALIAKDVALILWNSLYFVGLMVGLAITISLKNYATESLSIEWRRWFTLKFVGRYLHGEHNYLELSRLYKQLDNPDQRMQEDVDTFVDKTLSLGLGALQATITLPVFITMLWIVGGSITFIVLGATITIPGYLVWISLAVALITGLITHLIASPLKDINNAKANAEANLRKEMQSLDQNAESIAQLKGEKYFEVSIPKKYEEVYDNDFDKLNVKTALLSFQTIVSQLPMVLPYLAALPLYLTGQVQFAQITQIGMAFGQVDNSLGWFASVYETWTEWKSSLGRLIALDDALEGRLKTAPKNIRIEFNNTNEIIVRDLSITEPSCDNAITNPLNVIFNLIHNTTMKGPSGTGKSSLLKVISGTWTYGNGTISLPKDLNIYVIPQRNYMPNDTFKAVLSFPEPSSNYENHEYITMLRKVGLEKHIDKLDLSSDRWSQELSGGEQLRVAFARALFSKSNFLVLDEATAALDYESEQELYELVNQFMTLLSVSHRPSTDNFHSQAVFFPPKGSSDPIEVKPLHSKTVAPKKRSSYSNSI